MFHSYPALLSTMDSLEGEKQYFYVHLICYVFKYMLKLSTCIGDIHNQCIFLFLYTSVCFKSCNFVCSIAQYLLYVSLTTSGCWQGTQLRRCPTKCHVSCPTSQIALHGFDIQQMFRNLLCNMNKEWYVKYLLFISSICTV